MILEIADILIQPGRQAAFELALKKGFADVFPQARGFRGHEIHHGLETPERYVLMLHWDTLEDHTVGFRQSLLYAQWRGLVGEYFAQAPRVEHFTLIDRSGS